MKLSSILLSLFALHFVYSQNAPTSPPDTEVYLFDLSIKNNIANLTNARNISDNDGYDNQPSFLDDDYILFSSTRNGQTDIARYHITYGSKTWLNFSPGSEYSPTKIPGQEAVSAINLEADGTQRLFKYSLSTGQGEVLIDDIVIGYHLWYNESILISAVLENNMLNLYKTDINTGFDTKLAENVGRSLHKIPNSKLISYISKTNPNNWEIRSLDIQNGISKPILETVRDSEDMVWLNNESIIMGNDNLLFINTANGWKEWADLKPFGIKSITRLAINSSESKIAVVGEDNGAIIRNTNDNEPSESPTVSPSATEAEAIVQSHIDPYNQGDLDNFLNPFAENIIVSRFPNNAIYQGKTTMRRQYKDYFQNNENLSVKVNKRIQLQNVVIDEELATENTKTHRQVTIYTVENGKIQSMTFIQNTDTSTDAERLVNEQIEAYNRRDIDDFMRPYSDDVQLFNYPNELRTDGADAMKQSYQEFFDRTPDLRGVVQNRIIIGNKVIDQEHVTINGQILNAVAIYEVENGKIVRVTFIQ